MKRSPLTGCAASTDADVSVDYTPDAGLSSVAGVGASGASVVWAVPGSKSFTNRALLLAALAEGTSTLTNVLRSDDTARMTECLRQLGVSVVDDGTTTVVTGPGRFTVPDGELFVGNSGTTVRFLAAAAALVPGPVRLVGDLHMAKRPIGDLVEGLSQLGVNVDCPTNCPPLTVHGLGKNLPGGKVHMRGDRSSQYFSGLLMAAAGAQGPVEIKVDGELVSRPYVRMTNHMIAEFGGKVEERADDAFVVHPIGRYQSRSYAIEPDASTASYPFAFAAATGRSVRVPGLTWRSLQGDVGFVDVLARAGCEVADDDEGITVTGPRPGGLHGVDVDMFHISDTVMTLAAIAPLAVGPTTIRNIANIRLKETDRLAALVAELRRLGQEVDFGDDWLRITPRPILRATIECYSDHRMAMSFGVLQAAVRDRVTIAIADPTCVGKTYPGFWDDIADVVNHQRT